MRRSKSAMVTRNSLVTRSKFAQQRLEEVEEMANLWKWSTVMVMLVMTIAALSSGAAASEIRTEAVSLSSTVSGNSVNGYAIIFTAVTLKYGSTYRDSWEGATKVSTVLDANGYYVSTATFSATGVPAGTYPVAYHIRMSAGASDLTWAGQAAGTVITDDPAWGVPPRAGTSGAEI